MTGLTFINGILFGLESATPSITAYIQCSAKSTLFRLDWWLAWATSCSLFCMSTHEESCTGSIWRTIFKLFTSNFSMLFGYVVFNAETAEDVLQHFRIPGACARFCGFHSLRVDENRKNMDKSWEKLVQKCARLWINFEVHSARQTSHQPEFD